MTEYQPTPQTPEQVDEGLRNAFRQAIKDGVMDATPYLKQMTYKSDIEKTEAEIKVLQKKLELLKEIETHKSQSPRMEFGCGGKFEIVSYNSVDYCRYEWNDGSHKWYKRKYADEGVLMIAITDGETHRLLEGVWFNDVKKGKYDDVVDEHKSPVEEAYKDWWGIYPELENDTEYDETRWSGFQAGFQAAYEEKVREDDYYNEVEKDNPNLQKIIDKMVEERKSQKLYNILKSYNYSDFTAENICNIVEEWLPKEQSASGSQNTFVECSVEGYNDCVRQMKEMLR